MNQSIKIDGLEFKQEREGVRIRGEGVRYLIGNAELHKLAEAYNRVVGEIRTFYAEKWTRNPPPEFNDAAFHHFTAELCVDLLRDSFMMERPYRVPQGDFSGVSFLHIVRRYVERNFPRDSERGAVVGGFLMGGSAQDYRNEVARQNRIYDLF